MRKHADKGNKSKGNRRLPSLARRKKTPVGKQEADEGKNCRYYKADNTGGVAVTYNRITVRGIL